MWQFIQAITMQAMSYKQFFWQVFKQAFAGAFVGGGVCPPVCALSPYALQTLSKTYEQWIKQKEKAE